VNAVQWVGSMAIDLQVVFHIRCIFMRNVCMYVLCVHMYVYTQITVNDISVSLNFVETVFTYKDFALIITVMGLNLYCLF